MDVTHTGSSMKWRTALLVLRDKHKINQEGVKFSYLAKKKKKKTSLMT